MRGSRRRSRSLGTNSHFPLLALVSKPELVQSGREGSKILPLTHSAAKHQALTPGGSPDVSKGDAENDPGPLSTRSSVWRERNKSSKSETGEEKSTARGKTVLQGVPGSEGSKVLTK